MNHARHTFAPKSSSLPSDTPAFAHSPFAALKMLSFDLSSVPRSTKRARWKTLPAEFSLRSLSLRFSSFVRPSSCVAVRAWGV